MSCASWQLNSWCIFNRLSFNVSNSIEFSAKVVVYGKIYWPSADVIHPTTLFAISNNCRCHHQPYRNGFRSKNFIDVLMVVTKTILTANDITCGLHIAFETYFVSFICWYAPTSSNSNWINLFVVIKHFL